jgi:hypothetical protein
LGQIERARTGKEYSVRAFWPPPGEKRTTSTSRYRRKDYRNPPLPLPPPPIPPEASHCRGRTRTATGSRLQREQQSPEGRSRPHGQGPNRSSSCQNACHPEGTGTTRWNNDRQGYRPRGIRAHRARKRPPPLPPSSSPPPAVSWPFWPNG